MNSVHLVGSIKALPVISKDKTVDEHSEFVMSVVSNFRHSDGEFAVEDVPMRLWRGESADILKSCKIGALISVRGRFELKKKVLRIVAEHVEILHAPVI